MTLTEAPPLRRGRLSRTAGFTVASASCVLICVSAGPARVAARGGDQRAPMLGIPVGAVLCGALVDHAAAPRRLTFTMVLGFPLIAVVLIVVSRETVTRTTMRQALTSLRPQVRVPAGAGRALLAMAALIQATWSMAASTRRSVPRSPRSSSARTSS